MRLCSLNCLLFQRMHRRNHCSGGELSILLSIGRYLSNSTSVGGWPFVRPTVLMSMYLFYMCVLPSTSYHCICIDMRSGYVDLLSKL